MKRERATELKRIKYSILLVSWILLRETPLLKRDLLLYAANLHDNSALAYKRLKIND